VDQRDSVRAWRTLRSCNDDPPWCALLGAYTASAFGELRRADSLAGVAERAMSHEERCARIDVPLLVPGGDRAEWLQRSCPQRLALERAFWWLADPFWSVPGNERRAEHFVRLVTVKLRTDLDSDERFDWRTRYGGDALAVMVIRYGWPSFVGWQGNREDLGHREWLKFHDAAVPTPSPEYMAPRTRTAPPYHAVVSAVTLTRDDWKEMSPGWDKWKRHWDANWWAPEHMPLAVSAILPVSDQTVFFRRADHALMALVSREPEVDSAIAPRSRFVATVAVSSSPDSIALVQPRVMRDGRTAFAVSLRDQAVVSIEMLPDTGRAPAGRSRFSVVPPAPLAELPRGEIALSQIALYDARSDAPATVDEALGVMFPSATVPKHVKLGLYWEVYGLREVACGGLREVRRGVDRLRLDVGECGRVLGAAAAVVQEVGRYPEQRVAPVRFAFVAAARAKKPVVRVLQQIVGHRGIARDAQQVGAQRTRRPIVEAPERLFVHLEWHGAGDALGRLRAQPLDVRQGDVTHYRARGVRAAPVSARAHRRPPPTPRIRFPPPPPGSRRCRRTRVPPAPRVR
jgi:hypothetical protein